MEVPGRLERREIEALRRGKGREKRLYGSFKPGSGQWQCVVVD